MANSAPVVVASDQSGIPVTLASVPSHAVTNAGTFATQSAVTAASGVIASGALASGSIAAGAVAAGATSFVKLEDVASADADAGVPALAVRKATPANTSGTDGDYEFLQISAGRLWTSTTVDAALPAGTNAIGKLAGNSGVDIGDVDVTSIVPGTAATNLGKAEDAAHTTGDTGVMALGVRNDSTAQTTIPGTDGDYSPFATDLKGNALVVGNLPHDAVDAGNPMKIGMRAVNGGTNPTAVAAADRTDWLANRAGVPYVIGGHMNVVTLRANYTAAQTNTVIVAGAANVRIYVTRVSVLCDNANTVDVQVRIGFAAATTPTTTGVLLSHPGIAAAGGVIEGSGSGILGIGAAADALLITCEVPTGGSLDVVVSYFTITES